MEMVAERRSDSELREVVDQAIEYKKTLGQGVAVAFLVEHYVPPSLLQRVLITTNAVTAVREIEKGAEAPF